MCPVINSVYYRTHKKRGGLDYTGPPDVWQVYLKQSHHGCRSKVVWFTKSTQYLTPLLRNWSKRLFVNSNKSIKNEINHIFLNSWTWMQCVRRTWSELGLLIRRWDPKFWYEDQTKDVKQFEEGQDNILHVQSFKQCHAVKKIKASDSEWAGLNIYDGVWA